MGKGKLEDELSPLNNVFVGSIVDGLEIELLYSKGVNYAIYKFKGRRGFNFVWSNDGIPFEKWDERNAAVARLEGRIGLCHEKFKGELPEQVDRALISALQQIFKLQAVEKSDDIIDQLDVVINDAKAVLRIFGREKDFCVWEDESGSIKWRSSKRTSQRDAAAAEFVRLRALADVTLPEKHRANFRRRLAGALVACMRDEDERNVSKYFLPLNAWLTDTSHNEVRVKLLLYVTATSWILIAFGVLIFFNISGPPFFKGGAVCATAGVAGALISFLERSKLKSIKENDLPIFLILSNVSRVALGGLFGVIAYAAINAGIAFSLFKGSNYGLLLVGVASGFSERLIPDIIGSISSGSKTSEINPKSQGEDAGLS